MRDLYDLRSAIVHGGYQITHPMHDAGLDKRVMDSFVRETRATDYGYALLISAVQKAIVKGWKYPRFAEVIEGERCSECKRALMRIASRPTGKCTDRARSVTGLSERNRGDLASSIPISLLNPGYLLNRVAATEMRARLSCSEEECTLQCDVELKGV
jgi:hypothetical protein